ncbi:hypothetical protein C2S53_012417 [Perilla frutescens var. hirtella]|uniref:MULE transposase domain-containing protein n=1 Tax=Perilla frutescens var. hirtella TaxID=608512 RepID=A0AAD4PCV7_PERFH|nr:hypothetical protein C2S53_012417 [Perilla frutescens var. hirtella]
MQMTSWQSVIVRYGDQWESSEYVGGDEELTYIETDPMSLSSLIESVNRIMRANLLSFDYLLYYIARSRTGRTVKTLLSTDQDVIRLCAREGDPTVYVVQNQSTDGVTGPHEQPYIPSFNFSVPSSIADCETGYEPSINDIHKFYASDWFSKMCFGSGSGIASDLKSVALRQARARVIAAYFSLKMRNERYIMKPKEMQSELLQEFGIRTSYHVAFRARNLAMEMIYGAHEKSFEMLPRYLYMLKEYNPGTIAEFETESNGRFKYLFIALGACRTTFTMCCRPMIVIDGTHLKGKNKGILFVAVTKDGNESCFLLAVGVGPIKNDESWIWFLRQLRRAYGCNSEMVIVSDQHISISNTVEEVYPDTPYGICYYHLLNKIKQWGQGVVKMYHKAAYTYRPSVYEKAMASIKSTSPDAETFNMRLLWARRFPICSLIETIRHVIEQWFDERRRVANARIHDLTEEAVRKLSVEVQKSYTYTVKKCTQSNFKVNDGRRNFIVDLYAQEYQCGEFQEDRMPCSHAAAAIRDNGQHVYDYVETYYKASTLRDTYELPIHSLPNLSEWVVPSDVAKTIVLSPIITCQAGHRNMRRRSSHGETSARRRKTCSICGE